MAPEREDHYEMLMRDVINRALNESDSYAAVAKILLRAWNNASPGSTLKDLENIIRADLSRRSNPCT